MKFASTSAFLKIETLRMRRRFARMSLVARGGGEGKKATTSGRSPTPGEEPSFFSFVRLVISDSLFI